MSRPNRSNRTVPATLIFLLAAVSPPLLSAQSVPVDSTFLLTFSKMDSASPAPREAFKPPVASAVIGGTLGSGVGLVGGALVGYGMRSCASSEWFCGMEEAAVGALIGSVVGSTVGANIGARRGGATPTFGSTIGSGLAGVLVGIAGGYVAAQVDPDGPGALIGFTLGQGLVTGLVAARHR